MMIQSLLTFILIGLLLGSCVEKSNDFPQPESKLVVTGFISPEDDFTSITVLRTISSQQLDEKNSYNDVKDAQVTITDESGTRYFYYNGDSRAYITKSAFFKIEEGKTYRLDVRTPLNEHVWATCAIPGKINPLLSITISVDSVCDGVAFLGGGVFKKFCRYSRFDVQVKFDDIPGIQNYILSGEVGNYDSIPGMRVTFNSYGSLEFNRNEIWNAELKSDGALLGSFTGSLKMDFTGRTIETYAGRYAQIYLNTPDAEMAKYLKSIPDNSGFPSPFDEPVTLYSNINGGIGIFASYRKYSFIQKVF